MGKSKKHDKKSKKSKKSKRRERSSSSSESEEEWVEKVPELPEEQVKNVQVESKHDEWMDMDLGIPTISNNARRERREKEKQASKEPNLLNNPGQSSRELNPYWKDGGSGLPSEEKDVKLTKTVGDHGANWLKKALIRAKEEAAEKGVSLEQIVEERWGSLDNLKDLLNDAEHKESRRFDRYKRDFNRKERPEERRFKRPDSDDRRDHKNDRQRPEEDRRRFKRPGDSDNDEKDDRRDHDSQRRPEEDKRTFKRPGDDRRDYKSDRGRQEDRRRFKRPGDSDDDAKDDRRDHKFDRRRPEEDRRRRFKRPDDSDDEDSRTKYESKSSNYERSNQASRSSHSSKSGWRKHSQPEPSKNEEVQKSESREPPEPEETKILTKDEMNKLGAKMIKAEIMGDTELAEKIKRQLEKAREASETGGKSRQIVTLTETDQKGFTRPFAAPGDSGHSKKRRVATHENRERVRYFADDDKHSLQDMFENERFSSVADQNMTFAKLMGREMARKDGSLALDDPFEETAAIDDSAKQNKRKMDQTIQNQIKKEKAYDECRWCIMGANVQKDIIVTTRSKVYLCVPPFQSLTPNHCLIVPNFHVSCATQVDEDVWEDIMELRKILVKLFEKDEEDILFFEHAANFHKHPHMVLHCVPIPREIGDVAPIYFKKAMLECEAEWSDNKKVVELKGRDVRKAVPKELPYFSVDFGMQSGYAHVIEDYKLFPRNFAQEIIGGMMDLDHGIWRKTRYETKESIISKRNQLLKLFESL